jgi:hypothetical protein
MRYFVTIQLLVFLACSGGDGIYFETLPQPQELSELELRSSTEQLSLIAGRGTYEFEIESGVQSFLLLLQGNPGVEYLITELEGPDGKLVRADASSDEAASGLGTAAAPFFSPNRSVGDHGGATLLVPNDPRLRVSPGTWTAQIVSTSIVAETLRIDLLEQHAEARPAAVRIPLTIHLTGVEGMNSQSAAGHPRLQRAIDKIQSIYAGRSIRFEPVRFADIPGEFAELNDVELNSEQAKEMLAFGSGNSGINLFVIERFESSQGLLGSVGGVSAAIPGDPRGGELFAGIVVATSFSDDVPSSDLLGAVMAHEIGHFMGLFHVVEANGLSDHLSDTDEASDDNLMYHLSRPGMDQLSVHQGMILRSFPGVDL